ncbi:MAG: hypothetical protein KY476_00605 [Planctomycetes bacterium]|nr:hypothetical protein [Planctomycetota bacterium]
MAMGDTARARTAEVAQLNISIPADWLDAFKRAADAAGVPLSQWIRAACAAKLPAQERRQLSDPTPRGRPRKPRKS